MNGGMTECSKCDCDPCVCGARKEIKRITDGKVVVETALDVFAQVGRWRMKIIKLIWPDIKRLSNDLYDYWDKS